MRNKFDKFLQRKIIIPQQAVNVAKKLYGPCVIMVKNRQDAEAIAFNEFSGGEYAYFERQEDLQIFNIWNIPKLIFVQKDIKDIRAILHYMNLHDVHDSSEYML